MNQRFVLRLGLVAVGLFAIVGGAWILALPPVPAVGVASPIAKEEIDATIAALKPPKRKRPLIAIVGANEGTETTDYLMPYGILRRADVADVLALGTKPGPVTLYPALKVEPHAIVSEFDERHPEGPDYVIVPAMHRNDDPAVPRSASFRRLAIGNLRRHWTTRCTESKRATERAPPMWSRCSSNIRGRWHSNERSGANVALPSGARSPAVVRRPSPRVRSAAQPWSTEPHETPHRAQPSLRRCQPDRMSF